MRTLKGLGWMALAMIGRALVASMAHWQAWLFAICITLGLIGALAGVSMNLYGVFYGLIAGSYTTFVTIVGRGMKERERMAARDHRSVVFQAIVVVDPDKPGGFDSEVSFDIDRFDSTKVAAWAYGITATAEEAEMRARTARVLHEMKAADVERG